MNKRTKVQIVNRVVRYIEEEISSVIGEDVISEDLLPGDDNFEEIQEEIEKAVKAKLVAKFSKEGK